MIDGEVYPGEVAPALAAGAGRDVDIMVGTTREEMAAFYGDRSGHPEGRRRGDRGRVRRDVPIRPPRDLLTRPRRMRASPRQRGAARRPDDRREFPDGKSALCRSAGRSGPVRPMCTSSTGSHRRASRSCHCIEIPFVFNNFEHWTDSPMLEGGDSSANERASPRRCVARGAFARTGKPDHPRLPQWPVYTARGSHDHALLTR